MVVMSGSISDHVNDIIPTINPITRVSRTAGCLIFTCMVFRVIDINSTKLILFFAIHRKNKVTITIELRSSSTSKTETTPNTPKDTSDRTLRTKTVIDVAGKFVTLIDRILQRIIFTSIIARSGIAVNSTQRDMFASDVCGILVIGCRSSSTSIIEAVLLFTEFSIIFRFLGPPCFTAFLDTSLIFISTTKVSHHRHCFERRTDSNTEKLTGDIKQTTEEFLHRIDNEVLNHVMERCNHMAGEHVFDSPNNKVPRSAKHFHHAIDHTLDDSLQRFQ